MMKVHTLDQHSQRRGPFRRAIDELVLSAGHPDFEPSLFSSARAATGCEHLTAYSYCATSGPNLVLAVNPGASPIAREAGKMYVSQYWDRDPGNQLWLENHHESAMMVRVSGDDIRKAGFRQGCYDAVSWKKTGNRMIDRVSVIKRQRERFVKLSFHRAEWAGPFSDCEIDNIIEVADILTALVARHEASQPLETDGPVDRRRYVSAVRAVCPQLSQREAEICARIVLGITTEGMALDLDISINTVRTYRKRAYSRLNISSQNQLMKLVLPYVAAH